MLANPVDDSAIHSPPRPLARFGQLETDAFCSGCGYNLHGQDVSLDERLGFLICRCPECGRFHPAGVGTSANSVWVSRFGSILLVGWIGIVLSMAILAGLALGGIQAGFVSTYMWLESSRSGNFNNSYFYTTQTPPDADPRNIPGAGMAALMCSLALVTGFATGLLAVAFLWHWPRRRYALVILLPILAAGFVLSVFFSETWYRLVRPWCVGGTLTMLLFESIGILAAIWLGRPLARSIVRMIVPPKPRQLFTFLWRVDGKVMPGTAVEQVTSSPVERSVAG